MSHTLVRIVALMVVIMAAPPPLVAQGPAPTVATHAGTIKSVTINHQGMVSKFTLARTGGKKDLEFTIGAPSPSMTSTIQELNRSGKKVTITDAGADQMIDQPGDTITYTD